MRACRRRPRRHPRFSGRAAPVRGRPRFLAGPAAPRRPGAGPFSGPPRRRRGRPPRRFSGPQAAQGRQVSSEEARLLRRPPAGPFSGLGRRPPRVVGCLELAGRRPPVSSRERLLPGQLGQSLGRRCRQVRESSERRRPRRPGHSAAQHRRLGYLERRQEGQVSSAQLRLLLPLVAVGFLPLEVLRLVQLQGFQLPRQGALALPRRRQDSPGPPASARCRDLGPPLELPGQHPVTPWAWGDERLKQSGR
mmetsp:Transcript_51812/g.118120  ORF Transcript_51812/g.118120 Transcript_51812/m.118120 type:complete len:249 (+) Transcript_51812:103-849(+)